MLKEIRVHTGWIHDEDTDDVLYHNEISRDTYMNVSKISPRMAVDFPAAKGPMEPYRWHSLNTTRLCSEGERWRVLRMSVPIWQS